MANSASRISSRRSALYLTSSSVVVETRKKARNMTTPTHIAFSDESRWNLGRYRSISVVSMRADHHREVEELLERVFQQEGSKAREFKWSGRWHKPRMRLAKCLVDAVSREASRDQLRVDTITWDMQDARHRDLAVDDVENFGVMYFQVMKHVLLRRWPKEAVWALRLDQKRGFDREALDRVLTSTAARLRTLASPGRAITQVSSVSPVISSKYRTVQVADLFAGVAAFSWEYGDEHRRWRRSRTVSLTLLPVDPPEVSWTDKNDLRHGVLGHLREQCPKSLIQKSVGLETARPLSPINFWLYRPQHHRDKAPFREPGGRIVRARDRDRSQASKIDFRVG